jgi:hypothetical protein
MNVPLDKRVADMTAAELQLLIETSVEHSFARVALPIDGADNMRSAQKDFLFLRNLRESSEAAKNKVLMTVLGAAIAAVLLLVSLGSQQWIKNQ